MFRLDGIQIKMKKFRETFMHENKTDFIRITMFVSYLLCSVVHDF